MVQSPRALCAFLEISLPPDPSPACLHWSIHKPKAEQAMGEVGSSETNMSLQLSVPCLGGPSLALGGFVCDMVLVSPRFSEQSGHQEFSDFGSLGSL